jgi:hypothetical protein
LFGYKATELREIEDTDFHTSYEKIIEVWGWKNKNKKGKGKLVGKVIKDTYGRVFRVHLIPKSETDKTLKTAMLYAKQMLEQELLDESSGE